MGDGAIAGGTYSVGGVTQSGANAVAIGKSALATVSMMSLSVLIRLLLLRPTLRRKIRLIKQAVAQLLVVVS